jgi:hypothetical protein
LYNKLKYRFVIQLGILLARLMQNSFMETSHMKSWILTSTNKIVVAALVLVLGGALTFAAGSAYANGYGTNITINDGKGYSGSGAGGEDNETEPSMVLSQAWDLEGFFLNGKSLTIIGGYNFYTGQNDGRGNIMKAGDIFIDTDGDAFYSPAEISWSNYNNSTHEVSNSFFKYDYVLDICWELGTYKLIELSDTSVLKGTWYGSQWNVASNPWVYVSGGQTINSGNIAAAYGGAKNGNGLYTGATFSDTGFSGMGSDNNHYVATFDISAIPNTAPGIEAVFHNTMECGNDNLIGKAALVPEPSTLILIITGFMGVGLVRRKIRK